jgi:hypothetical protein
MNLPCPVCESEVEIPKDLKPKQRITCPVCFAQMALTRHNGKPTLACALCSEPVFDPDGCAECERRHEGKTIINEGKL